MHNAACTARLEEPTQRCPYRKFVHGQSGPSPCRNQKTLRIATLACRVEMQATWAWAPANLSLTPTPPHLAAQAKQTTVFALSSTKFCQGVGLRYATEPFPNGCHRNTQCPRQQITTNTERYQEHCRYVATSLSCQAECSRRSADRFLASHGAGIMLVTDDGTKRPVCDRCTTKPRPATRLGLMQSRRSFEGVAESLSARLRGDDSWGSKLKCRKAKVPGNGLRDTKRAIAHESRC